MARANDFQIGGKHYAETDMQAWDAITAWGLGYLDGNVVKYISRWRKKGGLQDLLKAQHFLSKVIEEVEQEIAVKKMAGTINPEAAAEKFSPAPQLPKPPQVQPVTMNEDAKMHELADIEDKINELSRDMETSK